MTRMTRMNIHCFPIQNTPTIQQSDFMRVTRVTPMHPALTHPDTHKDSDLLSRLTRLPHLQAWHYCTQVSAKQVTRP